MHVLYFCIALNSFLIIPFQREAEFFSLLNFIKLVDDLMTQQLAASSSHRNSQVNDELIELIRKLSQQLSVNTFTQLNGIPR